MDEDTIKAVAASAFIGMWTLTTLGLTRIHDNHVGGAETVGRQTRSRSWLDNHLDRLSAASISPRNSAPPQSSG